MSVRAFICSESVYLGSRGREGSGSVESDDLTVFCLAFSVLLLQRLKGQPSCLLAIWGRVFAVFLYLKGRIDTDIGEGTKKVSCVRLNSEVSHRTCCNMCAHLSSPRSTKCFYNKCIFYALQLWSLKYYFYIEKTRFHNNY